MSASQHAPLHISINSIMRPLNWIHSGADRLSLGRRTVLQHADSGQVLTVVYGRFRGVGFIGLFDGLFVAFAGEKPSRTHVLLSSIGFHHLRLLAPRRERGPLQLSIAQTSWFSAMVPETKESLESQRKINQTSVEIPIGKTPTSTGEARLIAFRTARESPLQKMTMCVCC